MIAAEAIHTEATPQSIGSCRGTTTILLVDDDSAVLSALSAILKREGYTVIAAASPLAALQSAAERAFDMLITDYQMPSIDGFTLAKHLARGRIALPVLIISGSDPGNLPMAEIAERNWNFMSKPIDIERLLRIVDGECLGWALRMYAHKSHSSQNN